MDKKDLEKIYKKSFSICTRQHLLSNEDAEEISQSVVLKYLEFFDKHKTRSKSCVVQTVIDQIRLRYGRYSNTSKRKRPFEYKANEKRFYKEYNEATQSPDSESSIEALIDIKRKIENLSGKERMGAYMYFFLPNCKLNHLADALDLSTPRVSQIFKKIESSLEGDEK